MKSFVWTLFSLAMLPHAASAGTVTGSASLTIWPDFGSFYSLDIQEEDGVLVGNSGLSSNNMFRVEQHGNELRGYADDGFVRVTCDAGRCSGQIGSGTVSVNYTVHGSEMTIRGSLNHVFVDVKVTGDKLELYGDGSMSLTRRSNGGWDGTGFLNRDPRSRFNARLELAGSLAGRLTDPGFVLTTLVAPFVRNN
jgi:hypothetical protein